MADFEEMDFEEHVVSDGDWPILSSRPLHKFTIKNVSYIRKGREAMGGHGSRLAMIPNTFFIFVFVSQTF